MSDDVVKGNNFLALTLHKVLAKNGQNVIFSPFSLSSAFSMLLYGTEGEAATEMRKTLGLENIQNDKLVKSFNHLLSSLESDENGYTVSYGNALVIHKDFKIHEQIISDLQTYFKVFCTQADFVNDSAGAVNQINEYVRGKTQDKIPKLLESLETNTVMVLLNAVYFKGFWLNQFQEKSSFMQYFYNDGDEENANLVEMMHLKEEFPLDENDTFKALQLPYKGEEVAMMILLPNSRNGLENLEDGISTNFIQDIKSRMHKQKVEVALPKFKLEYSNDLKEIFQQLGMSQIFESGADFSGFSDCKDLVVSHVVHKAVLEVNEEGCEAAAATAITIMYRCMVYTPEFIVDHPFLFVIYNTKSNLILFMGRVNEL